MHLTRLSPGVTPSAVSHVSSLEAARTLGQCFLAMARHNRSVPDVSAHSRFLGRLQGSPRIPKCPSLGDEWPGFLAGRSPV